MMMCRARCGVERLALTHWPLKSVANGSSNKWGVFKHLCDIIWREISLITFGIIAFCGWWHQKRKTCLRLATRIVVERCAKYLVGMNGEEEERTRERIQKKTESYSKGNPFVKVKQNISLLENVRERKNHTNPFFTHFRGAFSAIDKTKYAYLCFVINSFSNSPISIFFHSFSCVFSPFVRVCVWVGVRE